MEASKSCNGPVCSRGNKFAIVVLHLALGARTIDRTAATICPVQNAN
jgi:hypothetical protein